MGKGEVEEELKRQKKVKKAVEKGKWTRGGQKRKRNKNKGGPRAIFIWENAKKPDLRHRNHIQEVQTRKKT